MRILLDENMPRKLLAALVAEGHEVDSVKSLQLQGIDNGALYQFAASNYDLCFTRDAEFSRRVLSKPAASSSLRSALILQALAGFAANMIARLITIVHRQFRIEYPS